MVSTRKKDYGEPGPLKRGAPQPTQQDESKESHTANQMPCTEFTFFPKLPHELRIDVWKASMTPRLVVVEPHGDGYRRHRAYNKKILPAQFSVNSEAREIAVRRYNLGITVTLIVDKNGDHRWSCPSFRGIMHHANVVMSPDDTLGLFGWDTLLKGVGWKVRVESVDLNRLRSWNRRDITMCGAQPEVKKVAFLGYHLGSRPKLIHTLNSIVSLDMNTVLHTESTTLRKLNPDGRYNPPRADKYMDNVLIHSRKFSGTLQDWVERLLFRARRDSLPSWFGAPDIVAFELGKEPEEVPRPKTFVDNKWMDPEGYYLWHEWRWRRNNPCPQGF
jgi:hypothetical protein